MGTKLDWTVPLDATANGRTYVMTTIGLAVDLNGNVMVRRLFTQNNPAHPGIEFDLFGMTGNLITRFSIATDLGNGLGYSAGDVGELAITQNVVYSSVMACNANYSGCTTDPAKLYAISVPGLRANYPQQAIVGGNQAACPNLQFVGVRGSGETKDKDDGLGVTVKAVKDELLKEKPNMAVQAIDYTATPVNLTNLNYGSDYVNNALC